ncbi:MAG: PAS domain-containing protein, partial [Schleiferiaceae bacterium]|nr:PAS domain-containing protein [Schleiferiaceae bacterium]
MFKRSKSTGSENEKKEYEFLFNTMTQGVVFQNHKGEITKINNAAEELLGASFEQLSGKTSMDPRWKAIYPDGKPFHGVDHPAMVALRTGQAVKNVEMGVFHPKKQAYNWLLVSAHPIFDNNSTTPTRVFASFADITNQKLVEKQLINQQKQERILANNLPGIGYIQDAQFNLEYVNNKIFEVYELPLDSDITNFSLESLIHLEDLERVLVERSRALSERKHFEIEYRIVVNNNKIKHVIDSGEGIFENNKLIRVVGFIRDITKNKSIITQLESTISILKESGKVAKIGYWEADMLSGSLFWLPETYRLFERDPNQPPEMKDVFKYYKNNEVLEKAIESAISEGIDYDIETEIETSTGKTRWFRTVGKTIFDNNACSKIYGLVQDITDQRNALEELRHQFQLQELLL